MRIIDNIVESEISIEEDLVLAVDFVFFKKNIKCKNIVSEGYKRSFKARNIDAWHIDAGDIHAWHINAGDIDARNIDAGDIDARDIDAENIVCVSRKKKSRNAKTIAYSLTVDRFNLGKKERMPEEKEVM